MEFQLKDEGERLDQGESLFRLTPLVLLFHSRRLLSRTFHFVVRQRLCHKNQTNISRQLQEKKR